MNKPPRGDAGVAGTVLARLFPRGRSTRSSTSGDDEPGDESAPSRIAAAAARGVTALALGVTAFFPGGRPRFLPGVVAARTGVLGGRPRGLPELCGTIDLGGRPRFFPADVAAAALGASIDLGGRPRPRFGVVAGVFATTGVLGGRPRFLGSVAPGVFAAAAARGLEGGGWDGVSFAIGVRLESMDF